MSCPAVRLRLATVTHLRPMSSLYGCTHLAIFFWLKQLWQPIRRGFPRSYRQLSHTTFRHSSFPSRLESSTVSLDRPRGTRWWVLVASAVIPRSNLTPNDGLYIFAFCRSRFLFILVFFKDVFTDHFPDLICFQIQTNTFTTNNTKHEHFYYPSIFNFHHFLTALTWCLFVLFVCLH